MLTTYQLKNARLLLCISKGDLARRLGRARRSIRDMERGVVICRKDTELAIKFLLVEAGLYAHFRMIYMRKDKLKLVEIERTKEQLKHGLLINDALSFKYDS